MMRRMVLCLACAAASPFVCVVITGFNAVDTCVETKILRRVHATPGGTCEFLTARPSHEGRVVAEKRLSEELFAPDALVDFHTGRHGHPSRTVGPLADARERGDRLRRRR